MRLAVSLARHVAAAVCVLTAILIGAMPQSQAQGGVGLVYDGFDPAVIPVERTEPVRYEIKVQGRPSGVVLQLDSGGELALRDDGAGADRVAGDNVWATFVEMGDIVGRLSDSDVFRPFVGFAAVFEGGIQALRGNVFAEVITDAIPRLPVTRLTPNAQRTDVLVNIVDPNLAHSLENNNLDVPTSQFYQLFGDDYDFISVISARSFFSNRVHFAVKNEVSGIGLRFFNDSFNYGSSGRLQGISVFPNTNFYDGAAEGFQHELAHQWVMFVDTFPFAQGIAHWPLSSMASGIMGWSNPFNGQGQDFPCEVTLEGERVRLTPRDTQNSPGFTAMDLYLMGLLPASAVGEHVVFADQDFDRLIAQCDGGIYEGEVIRVSAQNIIDIYGPRFPDAANAPKTFRIATIIVSPDVLVSEDMMAFFSFFTRRAELQQEVLVHAGFFEGASLPFFLSTGGLGSFDVGL